MKNTIPKKIPVLFSRPKKIPFLQNVRPKKILRTPPSLKYGSRAPGDQNLPFRKLKPEKRLPEILGDLFRVKIR